MSDPTRDPAPAVTRALRVLELLEQSGGAPLTLSDLSRALGAAVSTSNVCAVLEDGGDDPPRRDRVPPGPTHRRARRRLRPPVQPDPRVLRRRRGRPVLRGEVVQVGCSTGPAPSTSPGTGRPPPRHPARLAPARRHHWDGPGDALPPRRRASRRSSPHRDARHPARGAGPHPDRRDPRARLVHRPRPRLRRALGVGVPLEPWRPSDPPLALGVALPAAEADEETLERLGRAAVGVAAQLTNPFLRPAD